MQNKGAVVVLTIIVTILCLYYLSFTLVSRGIQKDATEYATDENGNTDFIKKQNYLDSIWNEPIYTLFGADYTFQEIKETELNLGLDLQGGMHVILEVSPVDILKGLSGNNEDPDFLAAIRKARQDQRNSQEGFTSLFYKAFQEANPGKKLSEIFASAANRGRIDFNSSDEEILDIIEAEIEDAISRSFNILRTRIDRFGASQPNIQRLQGTGRIQVEIPGADNPERVRKLLQGVAKLEFWEVADPQEFNNSLIAINDLLVEEQKAQLVLGNLNVQGIEDIQEDDLADLLAPSIGTTQIQTSDTSANELIRQLTGQDTIANVLDSLSQQISPIFALLQSNEGLVYNVKDTSKINRILRRSDVKALLPRTIKFIWDVKPHDHGASAEPHLELYVVRVSRGGKAPLTGEVITDARQDLDQATRPAVSMQMNATGAKIWKRLTADNINRRIAIALDNYVYSAPTVINEIPTGNSQITGNFTLDEAKDLANILKAGSLPAPTRIVQEAIIGPSLGREAQQQGIMSILLGLLIVVLFMVAYYAKGGFVANFALAFNVFFILGILAQLNAALTLPGIAGIVLTIGMSIDANVLIFERIREELRNGVALREAISTGYKKAYSSIIDSNVTTFLTALILNTLGQGPVKGFAITLMIGIACSFFSSVFITRVIVDFMARKGDSSKVSFSTPFSKGVFSRFGFDFIGKRKIAYLFSSTFIAIGMILISLNGLNLGVDFKGGRSYVVTFSDPVVASDMKTSLLTDFQGSGTEVKTFGGNNVVKITTSYLVDDESDSADATVERALISGLENFSGKSFVRDDSKVDSEHFTISSSNKVGATIADDIKVASLNAGFFAIIAIFLYILIRFRKWQFSVGAIIALVHDALFVFSAFAIASLMGFSYEVDQVFVAAILTIIGYSINDTVIVFDRIRENIGLKTSDDKIAIFNTSINSTLNRTLITSATTLIVVIVLLIFGGEVLRGFSFALLVGVVIGTYSSVFIATPIVIDLDKKAVVAN